MGPAFNRLWAGSIVSNLADGVLIAAAPLLAITLTDSTVLISIIGDGDVALVALCYSNRCHG